MILTITTTHNPATDLGYLLAKHPAKAQVFKQNFGTAHVFYAEATAEKCTAVLLLEIDSIKLVRRGGKRQAGFSLQQYVNNRPYVASSFLSVAIADVFRTALNGRCKDKPELVKTAIPLTAKIGALPCRGGEAFLRDLFEPLGYTLIAEQHPLDPKFPEWGNSKIFTVELRHTIKLSELLSHLYVLIPVLDDEKHYWVGEHEVEKLLAKGGNWLAVHPQKEEITRRYLKRRRGLVGQAMAQLNREEATDKLTDAEKDAEETVSEKKI
ncbi:MAG: 3' terminal RNA ribose 2'-O-methyltransferase Hen1, partial [Chloroflexota bacterium]